jgi:hypothetical protein
VISKDPEQKLDNFLAGFCHKFNSDKSTCFKVISQGFLEDDIVWVRCGYFGLKILASIVAFNIADYTMANI